jgi:hypothetical protein
LTVNSTADPGAGGCNSTEYTLREAITASNGLPTTDTINFNIPDGPAPGRPGGLGIALNNDGVTANDNKDPDTGPNKLQNFPIISSASTTTVTGRLNKDLHHPVLLQPRAELPDRLRRRRRLPWRKDSNDQRQGQGLLQLQHSVSAGQIITATATDSVGNTSEFSQGCTVG